VQWQADGLDFFGWARLGTEPVYAVADGYLTRLPEWSGTVAILHDDPLRPGELVWTYYGNMLNASGQESYVLPDYPTGSAARPVKQGDLLGYQGNWSGRPNFGVWMHVRFAVIQPAEDGSFPEKVTGENMLDPSPYLGLANSPQDSSPGSQQLTCNQ
jgi:peptidoglycan LD-endopeptidase LytH